jgi:hypothetical protein
MDALIPMSQKLYLLGINPEKGGILSRSQSAMDYVILGGLLMELHLQKKINVLSECSQSGFYSSNGKNLMYPTSKHFINS